MHFSALEPLYVSVCMCVASLDNAGKAFDDPGMRNSLFRMIGMEQSLPEKRACYTHIAHTHCTRRYNDYDYDSDTHEP